MGGRETSDERVPVWDGLALVWERNAAEMTVAAAERRAAANLAENDGSAGGNDSRITLAPAANVLPLPAGETAWSLGNVGLRSGATTAAVDAAQPIAAVDAAPHVDAVDVVTAASGGADAMTRLGAAARGAPPPGATARGVIATGWPQGDAMPTIAAVDAAPPIAAVDTAPHVDAVDVVIAASGGAGAMTRLGAAARGAPPPGATARGAIAAGWP